MFNFKKRINDSKQHDDKKEERPEAVRETNGVKENKEKQ